MAQKELTQEQIHILANLKRTGFLNVEQSKKIVFDMIRESYIYFSKDEETGVFKRTLIKKEISARKKAEDITGCPGAMVLSMCDTVDVEFNPLKDESFYVINGDKIVNEFDVEQTMLGTRDFVNRNFTKRHDDIKFLDKYTFTKKLLFNLFSSEEGVDYIINWLSSIINTRSKLTSAILVNGSQGTGKGVLQQSILKAIFGIYLVELGSDTIEGVFNGALENKMFVVFNEVSVDFNKRTGVSGKLKRWVSDEDLELNVKYGGQFEVQNHFNSMFFSNEATPLKIDTDDRRYSIFKAKTTLRVIAERMGMKVEEFVAKVKEEAPQFIIDLFAYNFDISRANKYFESEEKDAIAAATTSKIEILCNTLNNADYYWLANKVEENIEVMRCNLLEYAPNYENNLKDLKDEMKKGKLTNKTAHFLYTILVDEKETSAIKINTKFNVYLGDSKSSGGVRYRKLNKLFFENSFLEKAEKEVKVLELDKVIVEIMEDPFLNNMPSNITKIEEAKTKLEKDKAMVVEEVLFNDFEDFYDFVNDMSVNNIMELDMVKGDDLIKIVVGKYIAKIDKVFLNEKQLKIIRDLVIPF